MSQSTTIIGVNCKFCGDPVVIADWGVDGPGTGDYMDDERADVAHFNCKDIAQAKAEA